MENNKKGAFNPFGMIGNRDLSEYHQSIAQETSNNSLNEPKKTTENTEEKPIPKKRFNGGNHIQQNNTQKTNSAFNPLHNNKNAEAQMISQEIIPEHNVQIQDELSEMPETTIHKEHTESRFKGGTNINNNVSEKEQTISNMEKSWEIYDGYSQKELESSGINTIQALKLAAETPLEQKKDNINETILQPKEVKLTKKEEEKLYWQALSEKVDNILLKEVMDMLNASGNEDRIRNKYKMSWGDNISIKGQRWYNHNRTMGGVGAVSLVIQSIMEDRKIKLSDVALDAYYQKKAIKQEAITQLAETFGEAVNNEDIKAAASDYEKTEKKGFSPPLPLPKQLSLVKEYLINERHIPEWVVDKQIKAGKIYAGVPDWMVEKTNISGIYSEEKVYCVFLSKQTAECRAIRGDGYNGVKQVMAAGSEKGLFGFLVMPEKNHDEKIVVVTEGAIDAMSYHSLYPGRCTISAGGTDNNDFLIRVAMDAIENGYKFCLSLDNDKAGDQATKIFNDSIKLKIGAELYDSYITNGLIFYDKPPIYKDWNEHIEKAALIVTKPKIN